MGHDIKALEKKVTALSNALAKLGKGTDLKDLILILRRPGWTTPAEYFLVDGLLNNLNTQVANVAQLKADLVRGSKMVGK